MKTGAIKNSSVKREAVLDMLKGVTSHPTAVTVYDEVRKTYPHLSLGTVYRNLSQLVNEGVVQTVDVGDGQEHYDANFAPHEHFHCENCGAVIDIDTGSLPFIKRAAAEASVHSIHTFKVIYYGVCKSCKG